MVRLKRGKAAAVLEEETVEEEPTEVLQKLMDNEANLIEEKQNLVSLKEKLRIKVQKEIEDKKSNIQKLRDEIMDLKFSCEELTKALKTGTKRNESNEADKV